MKFTINSQDSLSSFIGKVRELFKTQRYLEVSIKERGKHRSINQNFVSHGWYKKVSVEEGEYTPEDVKCLCKLHFGLPILRADDEEYNAACEKVIDPLPYESKIEAMRYFPCTSLMTTKQKSLYMQHVQAHYAGRVVLEFED